MPLDQDSQNEINHATPVIRSILAFLIYMRIGHDEITDQVDTCYSVADQFIKQLKKDISK